MISLIILCTAIIGNEFTKPAREKRKEKMQQDAACEECIKLIDTLMGRICTVQQQLSMLTGSFYRILRSCAADDTPEITQREVSELKALQVSLQTLEKQLQSMENHISGDVSLQRISCKI